MNDSKKIISLVSALILFSSTGCNRKNNPFLSSPASGTTGVTLFIPQIDTNSTSENRIFTLVTDQGGTPLSGFQIGNFTVVEDGDVGVTREVGRVTDLLYLALIIDRSGSMAGQRTTDANNAGVALINTLSSLDYAAYIEFDDEIVLKVPFTTNKTTLTTAIAAGGPDGGTAYYDATAAGADVLQSVHGRKLLILLTDGEDTASSKSITQAIEAVNARGLSAYMVGLGDGIDPTSMQQIADQTGGLFVASDGSDLTAVFTSILDRFNSLNYVKYRRRSKGPLKVYLNYGTMTASASKAYD